MKHPRVEEPHAEDRSPMLFEEHPTLVWRLVALRWLPSLRDRIALAASCKALRSRERLDPSLLFVRWINSTVGKLTHDDRLRLLKRSGFFDCLQLAWDIAARKRGNKPIKNIELLRKWLAPVASTKNVAGVRWLLRYVRYEDPKWVNLVDYIAHDFLQADCGEEALQLVQNAGGGWWDAKQYADHVYTRGGLIPSASRFISAQRYDLYDRLVAEPWWPHKMNGIANQMSLAIMAAVMTEDREHFNIWWQSEWCAKLKQACSAELPMPVHEILGGVLFLMSTSNNARVAAVAQTMIIQLQPLFMPQP